MIIKYFISYAVNVFFFFLLQLIVSLVCLYVCRWFKRLVDYVVYYNKNSSVIYRKPIIPTNDLVVQPELSRYFADWLLVYSKYEINLQ